MGVRQGVPDRWRALHFLRVIVRAFGLRTAAMPVTERKQAMNRIMMNKLAVAVFAAGLAMGVSGTASAQVAGAYCNPNGATTVVVQGSWRNYYTCKNHKWSLTKACPVSGGGCTIS